MKLTDAEKQRLFRSREAKPPYATVRLGLNVSEQFMTTAKDLLFDLKDRPFKSVSELTRHAMAVGLIQMVEHGVEINRLRDMWRLTEEANELFNTQQAANKLLDQCRVLIDDSRTKFQEDAARAYVRKAIGACPDPEIVVQMKELL